MEAIIAHLCRQPGPERVRGLMDSSHVTMLVSAACFMELAVALKVKVPDVALRREIIGMYGGRIVEVVPVDREAALAANGVQNYVAEPAGWSSIAAGGT